MQIHYVQLSCYLRADRRETFPTNSSGSPKNHELPIDHQHTTDYAVHNLITTSVITTKILKSPLNLKSQNELQLDCYSYIVCYVCCISFDLLYFILQNYGCNWCIQYVRLFCKISPCQCTHSRRRNDGRLIESRTMHEY